MKKKILLIAVIAAMLICTLAIVVSAEGIHNSQTVNFNETVTLRDGTVCNLFDENGNALIWFRLSGELQSIRADDTDDSDGNWVEYILPKSNYPALANVKIHIGNSTVEASNIVIFNIMDDDIVADMDINTDGVQPFTVFIETFNKDNRSPWGTMKLEYAYLRHDTTAIGGKAFAKCVYLKYVNFENLTELQTIGPISTYDYGGAFVGCTSLFEGQTLDLSKTQLTAFGWGSQCAEGNFEGVPMSELKLPLTLETIRQRDFKDCTNLTTVYFGDLISSIESNAFSGCTNLVKIYFTGTEYQYLSLQDKITATGNDSLFAVAGDNDINVISYSDYNALSDKSGNHFVIGYSSCTYNNGPHGELNSIGPCVNKCTDCDATVANHNDDTNLSVSIIYSDYSKEGEKITTCQNDGCTYNVTEETPALFTCLGYSVGPDGYSLKAGYMVNIDAMTEFKTFHPSFSFGVVIANANTVKSEESFFVNEVINSSAKGLMVRVDDLQYAILNVDISNFSASIADSLQLVVGLYTNDGEGNMTVAQYINTENYPTAKTYSDMSLNAVTLNQARLAHGMDALVPPTPNKE